MKKGLLAGLVLALLTTLSGCFDCWDDDCYCDSCSSGYGYYWDDDWDDDWDDYYGGCGCSMDYHAWHERHCRYDWWSDAVICDSDWDAHHSCSSGCACQEDSHGNQGGDNHQGQNDHTDYARTCIRDASCYADEVCKDGYCVLKTVVDDNPDIEIVPECSVNADCSDDMICTDGRCIPCQTDLCDTSKEVECVFSAQCESGLCVDGVCLLPGKCAIDANCSEGQICVDGSCVARPECLHDGECGEGQICNASNACEDDVECRVDGDCGDGMICVSNMCAQCRLNCECPNEGDVCMNGFCVADDRVIK